MKSFHFLLSIPRKSLKEAFFTIGGRLLSVFLVIASTKFLTTFLSEAEYGKLALYNVTATLPSTFFFAPLGQGIFRYYPIAQERNEFRVFNQQFNGLFRAGAAVTALLGLLTAIICLFKGNPDWAIACLLIATLSIFNAVNTYRYGLQNAARQRTIALGLETGDRVLQQALAIALLWFVTGDPLMALVGYTVSAVFFFFINQYYYRRTFSEVPHHKADLQSNYNLNILHYAWPFCLFGIFTWLQTASDRWLLGLVQSIEAVGQYAVLNQIGFQSLTLLVGSISYFLIPILYNRAGSLNRDGQFEGANRLNNWYLWFNVLLTGGLCLLFWLFGEGVIRLFSTEKYVSVAGLLPIMALAGGLFNLGQTYSMRFMFGLQTKQLLYSKIGAAVIGVVLNYYAVSHYGILGLVWSSVLGQLIYLLLLISTWHFLFKDYPKPLSR